MIISASRRTDIPAYYSDWLCNRLREGFVLVKNPMNPKQVSRINLSPEVVDGIVFWTKNPVPMLDKLPQLNPYMYYFQFTLTPYGADMEPGLPSKTEVLIPAFQRLSDILGPNRVIWRYDPIIKSGAYDIGFHAEHFDKLADKLKDHTKKCTISFLDAYRHNRRALEVQSVTGITPDHIHELAENLSQIARSYGIKLDACAEPFDLTAYGIGPARCIDAGLFERLLGCRLKSDKDRAQRPECGCAASIDIGAYDTCQSGCRYCYAVTSQKVAVTRQSAHDPAEPMLCGRLKEEDKITERHVKSDRSAQICLFDDV